MRPAFHTLICESILYAIIRIVSDVLVEGMLAGAIATPQSSTDPGVQQGAMRCARRSSMLYHL
jgi:hypothetical protein